MKARTIFYLAIQDAASDFRNKRSLTDVHLTSLVNILVLSSPSINTPAASTGVLKTCASKLQFGAPVCFCFHQCPLVLLAIILTSDNQILCRSVKCQREKNVTIL